MSANAFHDTPWRAKRRENERRLRMELRKRPITVRLDEIKAKLQAGDICIDQALTEAYSEGVFDGRAAEPVVMRIGKVHTPEIES